MPSQDDPAIARVRDALERRGWSQRTLADRTLLGESTVFRLLKGQYTPKTLRKVERALDLLDETGPAGGHAPVTIADVCYGGYVRELYRHYEGRYVCLRPSFADPEAMLSAYPLTIAWSDAERGLTFSDGNPGYEQTGMVTVPTGTQFLHFVTLDNGSARLITAYHMPPGDAMIRGVVLTFANPRGRELYPAVAPILMVCQGDHVRDQAPDLSDLVGLIARSDARLQRYLPALAELQFSVGMLRG